MSTDKKQDESIAEKDWKVELSEQEYYVCREAGTERPFTGVLLDEQRDGLYVCKCCEAPLFPSDTKFDAGCGCSHSSFKGPVHTGPCKCHQCPDVRQCLRGPHT